MLVGENEEEDGEPMLDVSKVRISVHSDGPRSCLRWDCPCVVAGFECQSPMAKVEART